MVDENCGGFPKKADKNRFSSSTSNAKHCKMHTPNLVARLMGLESILVVNCDKPSKNVLSTKILVPSIEATTNKVTIPSGWIHGQCSASGSRENFSPNEKERRGSLFITSLVGLKTTLL